MPETPLAMAQAELISALRTSETRLLSLPDLVTKTRLDPDVAVEGLRGLVPDQVRISKIRNSAGNVLFAPADRSPSGRELRVTSKHKFVRGLARFYYLKVRGVSTCDL